MALFGGALPAHHKQTFSIKAPRSTHFRKASCTEVACEGQEHGWVCLIDERTPLGQRQAHYIRKESGRRFTEETENGLTSFTFEAGQTCFTKHEVPLGRPELYVVRNGDLAQDLGGVRVHSGADAWADDLQTTTETVVAAIENARED